jgi:Mn-dependent DtxR family transcriptional regulator
MIYSRHEERIMTDLPFHLKTIEPLKGALDIIRLLGATDEQTVHADAICDQLGLSDRSFSKAIRRLVTKGYVVMDGEMEYRLTEQGQDSVDELRSYDEATGGGLELVSESEDDEDFEDFEIDEADETRTVARRLVVAAPMQVVAEQANPCMVGVHPASESAEIDRTAELVVRVTVVNGEPERPEDLIFSLSNDSAQQSLVITPHLFSEIRVRVEAFQLGDNPGEIQQAGGMYFDIPVTTTADNASLTAYGTDIQLTV